ncbi:hypothetical protein [Azospirillum sp. ST 5-10]|uniref:hypothetical protein n=1 Tax=unclassified Azospirillum TaxID=2630922 RepID=UPI003F49B73F
MHALALLGALLLYGLFGRPAPATVGAAEAAVALALLLAVGARRPLSVVTGHGLHRAACAPWEAVAVTALAALLWPPLVRGAAMGWEARQMVRDVVPVLFLFLPAVLVPRLRPLRTRAVPMLGGGLAAAGVLFALRWWHEMEWGFGAVGTRAMPEGDAYLLNAPSVLFAAVALPSMALAWLAHGAPWQRLMAPALAAAGALCLAALAGAVHRMALGLAVAALVGVALWWAPRAPRLLAALLAVATAVVWALDDLLLGAVRQALEKSRAAGLNARGGEALAVLELVARSPVSLLVGEGWGARLSNPAVGGWRVPYTHTLASYALLKAGLVGVAALAGWLASLAPSVRRLLRVDPPLAAAVLPPLAVSLGLHTSFKYLDCGLLMTLLVLAAEVEGRDRRPVGLE